MGSGEEAERRSVQVPGPTAQTDSNPVMRVVQPHPPDGKTEALNNEVAAPRSP